VSHPEQRVLLFTPTGRDAEIVTTVLAQARIDRVACKSWPELELLFKEGAAALIISEEALRPGVVMRIRMLLREQPRWSDFPILLVSGRGADSAAIRNASLEMGNVTLLERPMRVVAMLSAVRGALRARARQYENRAQLEALEQTAVALRASELQLREAHARKDAFLATLAHELRNPLAPIRNALHVLRRKTPAPELALLHDIVERQVRQLARLVDDLLEVSRFTRGKISLHLERIDIATVLRSAIETSRPVIDAARHELVEKFPPEPVFVNGDALRLGQVFANLLNNAAKYTNDGGTITVAIQPRGSEVVVTIDDTGVGIPAEMLAEIFDMFTQIHESNDKAQGGLGIGLTLAKTLVELHGGHVEAHSDGAGRGSRFSVSLPRVER
jgi:signal transduction histidine kinase